MADTNEAVAKALFRVYRPAMKQLNVREIRTIVPLPASKQYGP
jgi:hypothetical protein